MKHTSFIFIVFLTIIRSNTYARTKKIKHSTAEQICHKNYEDLQKVFYKLQRSWDNDLQVYCKAAADMTNDEIILCYKDYLRKQNQTTSLKTPCFIIKCSKNLRDTCVSRVSNKKKSSYGIIEIHNAGETQSKYWGLAKTTHVTIEQAAFKINQAEHGYHEIENYKRSSFQQEEKGNILFSKSVTQHLKILPFPLETQKSQKHL